MKGCCFHWFTGVFLSSKKYIMGKAEFALSRIVHRTCSTMLFIFTFQTFCSSAIHLCLNLELFRVLKTSVCS